VLVVDPQVVCGDSGDVNIMQMKSLHHRAAPILCSEELSIAYVGLSFEHEISPPINLDRGPVSQSYIKYDVFQSGSIDCQAPENNEALNAEREIRHSPYFISEKPRKMILDPLDVGL
jgi:hypothetical protein